MMAKKKRSLEEEGRVVELKIPSLPEYVGVARLTLSGVASRMNLGYDEIEDLKIALAEACNNAIQHAYEGDGEAEGVIVRFRIERSRLIIEVEDKGVGFPVELAERTGLDLEKERGLGIFLIKSLVDEVEFTSKKDVGTKVRMIKHLNEGLK